MISTLARLRGLRRSAAAVAVALPIVAGGLSACTVAAHAPAGTYKPGPANTGTLLGSVLAPHYGDITVTRPGTVIQNMEIWGFVKVRAANVTIRNVKVHGSGPATHQTALIDLNSPSVKNAVIEDCELSHAFPSVWVDGVEGHDYTVRRCNIHDVVDGFGVFNASNPRADLNVDIEANWVHDLNYMIHDPSHRDGHTHNDCVQIQGTGATRGKVQVRLYGNNFQALAGPRSNARSPYFPAVTGQAIGITPNVSPVHDVTIDHNWLDGGAQSVTVIPGPRGAGSGLYLTNNRFGILQALVNRNGVRTRRPVLVDSRIQVSSWADTYTNGAPIAVYHWNVTR